MEILNQWIKRIPEHTEKTHEITKNEILSSEHCNLYEYLKPQHAAPFVNSLESFWFGLVAKGYGIKPPPEILETDEDFCVDIAKLHEIKTPWVQLLKLVDQIIKAVYFYKLHETFGSKKASYHNIRKALIADQQNKYRVFKDYTKEIVHQLHKYVSSLPVKFPYDPDLSYRAFYSFIMSEPNDIVQKVSFAIVSEILSRYGSHEYPMSTTGWIACSAFRRCLLELNEDLQAERDKILVKIEGAPHRAKGGRRRLSR